MSIDEGTDGVGSVFGVDDRLWLVGVFDTGGRATEGTTGVDEAIVVETLVVVVVFVVVFNGDVERRWESNRFNVSLVTVVVVVGAVIVTGAVVVVRHGVFITSRRTGGIAVGFVGAVVDVTDETVFVSATVIAGSGMMVVVDGVGTRGTVVGTGVGGTDADGTGTDATVGATDNPPFATSSITSSMCVREVEGVVTGVAIVAGCLSVFKEEDKTIFDTIVMSFAD